VRDHRDGLAVELHLVQQRLEGVFQDSRAGRTEEGSCVTDFLEVSVGLRRQQVDPVAGSTRNPRGEGDEQAAVVTTALMFGFCNVPVS